MFNPTTYSNSLSLLSSTIASQADFFTLAADWAAGDIRPYPLGCEAALNAFTDWLYEESERWATFAEWETFCLDNGMA